MAENVGTVKVNLLLGTCKTCRWWGGKELWRDTVLQPCTNPKLGCNEGDNYRDGKMVPAAHDEAGCSYVQSEIETGPDFGCIHHEVRDG